MPIGGNKVVMQVNMDEIEDKPLPKGTYNLDALGADAFGDGQDTLIQENTKPKKAPPARFA